MRRWRGRSVGRPDAAPAAPPVDFGACRAPFGSLYLDPHGDVRACCLNSWHRLGTLTDSTLREIWHGEPLRRLRAALRADDFGLGCEGCGHDVAIGDGERAYLRVFDALAPESLQPEWPERLELALSNSCNLQCTMCNGELSSSIRVHREHRPPLPVVYGERFFAELDEFLPHLRSVTFLGGEPFLATESLRVMERLVELGLRPRCHVTTNGTRWSPRIAAIVEALPIHVAISVDGATPATFEAVRVGASHAEVVANVDRFRAATAGREDAGCSLAFCLLTANWHELGATLRWADELDVDVFVNAVDSPLRMCLTGLPDAELRRVVDTLRAEAPGLERDLRRNLPVWRTQLAGLERALAARDGAAVALPHPALRRPADEPTDPAAAVIEVDRHELVTSVAPTSRRPAVPGLEALVGRPLRDLQLVLVEAFGPIDTTTLERGNDGVEERAIRFERGAAVLLVRRPAPGGAERWEVVVEEPVAAATIPPGGHDDPCDTVERGPGTEEAP